MLVKIIVGRRQLWCTREDAAELAEAIIAMLAETGPETTGTYVIEVEGSYTL